MQPILLENCAVKPSDYSVLAEKKPHRSASAASRRNFEHFWPIYLKFIELFWDKCDKVVFVTDVTDVTVSLSGRIIQIIKRSG